MGEPKRVFARTASGMVREISPLTAFLMAISGIAVGLPANFGLVWYGAIYPGASFTGSFAIALIPCLIVGLLYILFTITMPRSGGDYVFTSRTLSSPVGFTFSFVLMAWFLVFIAQDLAWTMSTLLGPALAGLGVALNNPGLVQFATLTSTDPTWELLFGLLKDVPVLIVLIFGPKYLGRWLLVLISLGLIGLLSNWIIWASSTPAAFNAAFQAHYGQISQILDTATKAGWSYQPISLGITMTSLPLAFFFFIGWYYQTYAAGEIKEIRKSMWISVLGSVIFGFILYSIMDFLFFRINSYQLNQALSYLFFFSPNNYFGTGLPTMAGTNFLAGIITPTPILNVLICLGQFGWMFASPTVMWMLVVRSIFAWSFDRVTPTWLSDLNRRFKSPLKATLTIFVVGVILAALYLYFPAVFLVSLNFTLGMSIAYIVPGIAGIVFPFRRKDIYDKSPIAKYKIGPIPIISIAGVITVLFFSYIVYAIITTPALAVFAGPSGIEVIGSIILTVVFGPIIYYGVRAYRKRKEGIDLSLASKEIPPG